MITAKDVMNSPFCIITICLKMEEKPQQDKTTKNKMKRSADVITVPIQLALNILQL